MKTAFFLVLLAFPQCIFGQFTNHFDQPDSRWNVATTFQNGNLQNPSFIGTVTKVYGFQGDSLVNSENWHKLYSTGDSLFQDNLVFQGLIRTDSNRVLFLDTLNQLDTLYDFNLNAGDYVAYDLYPNFTSYAPIVEIDSIQLNGQFYRRFLFDEPLGGGFFDYLEEVWIEGIGSIHGPLFPNQPRKFSSEWPDSMIVTCTTANGEQVWHHPDFEECYVQFVLGTEELSNAPVVISPNPFTDKITIRLDSPDPAEMIIYDETGQELIRETLPSGFETIDLSILRQGIYFVLLRNDRQQSVSKLVKHE